MYFYLLDSPTSFIAGFDFIVRAGLVIDPVNRLVWSKGVVLSDTVDRPTNLIDSDSVLSPNQHVVHNDQIASDYNCKIEIQLIPPGHPR